MQKPFYAKLDYALLIALLGYAAVLATLPFVMSEDSFRALFAETGPFEVGSIFGWVAVAVLIVLHVRPFGPRATVATFLAVVFAMREADMHKAFTGDGMSKLRYYTNAAHPVMERLIAGVIALAVVAAILYAFFASVRFLIKEKGWRTSMGLWLLLGVGMLPLTKVLDRSLSLLAERFDLIASSLIKMEVAALEEGLEAAMPLLLLRAVWLSRRLTKVAAIEQSPESASGSATEPPAPPRVNSSSQ